MGCKLQENMDLKWCTKICGTCGLKASIRKWNQTNGSVAAKRNVGPPKDVESTFGIFDPQKWIISKLAKMVLRRGYN